MGAKVIYHAGCADGWCAAWVSAKALGLSDQDLIPAKYGDPLPEGLGKRDEVYIVDFSYPADQLLELCGRVASVVVLDHHKTAQAELEGLERENLTVLFDMERSGAMLAYAWFEDVLVEALPSVDEVADVYNICRYVQDRDLWRWELKDSREVSAYLSCLPKTVEAWDEAASLSQLRLFMMGQALLMKQERQVEQLLEESNWRVVKFRAFEDVALVNVGRCAPVSEALGQLAEGRYMAVGWSQLADGSYAYSLRSSEGGADVGRLAAFLRAAGDATSGGGHVRAAGFESLHGPEVFFS